MLFYLFKYFVLTSIPPQILRARPEYFKKTLRGSKNLHNMGNICPNWAAAHLVLVNPSRITTVAKVIIPADRALPPIAQDVFPVLKTAMSNLERKV
jgi:hypothetical protein